MEQKVLEQLKFLGGEIQSLIFHHCDVTQPIQGDRAITQLLEPFRTSSSEKRSDAGHELVELKRLGEVIIGAGVQSADYVFGCVTRREHQDRSGPTLAPELSGNLEAVLLREHNIKQDGIVLVDVRHRRRLVPVTSNVHDVSFLPQSLFDESGDLTIVFHEENLHHRMNVGVG